MTPGLSQDSQCGFWSSKDTVLKKKKGKIKVDLCFRCSVVHPKCSCDFLNDLQPNSKTSIVSTWGLCRLNVTQFIFWESQVIVSVKSRQFVFFVFLNPLNTPSFVLWVSVICAFKRWIAGGETWKLEGKITEKRGIFIRYEATIVKM